MEKACQCNDTTTLWQAWGILLKAVMSFYENSSACVRMKRQLSEEFKIEVGIRQGCAMFPCLIK